MAKKSVSHAPSNGVSKYQIWVKYKKSGLETTIHDRHVTFASVREAEEVINQNDAVKKMYPTSKCELKIKPYVDQFT